MPMTFWSPRMMSEIFSFFVSELFKAPYEYLIPQIFLWSFWISLLFTPTDIITSGSCDVKQLPLIVSMISQGRELFSLVSSELGQIKTNSVNSSFPRSCQAGRVTILCIAPNPFCLLQWLLGCCFSWLLWLQAAGFQGYHGAGGGR